MSTRTGKETFSRVADFYRGKSLLITGCTGYLGTVLLEVLLTYLPEIAAIYILVRPKRGVDPQSRKDIIFNKVIFKKLLKSNPNVMDKVHVISGDVSSPNLGMTDEDLMKISETVSIVFHNAAIIKFNRTLKYMTQNNSMGTKYVIDVCRKLRRIDALIYASTAYSNSNYSVSNHAVIEEFVYRLPFNASQFVETIENGTDADLEALVGKCKPDWPNSYIFSKSLSENILNDLATGIPVAIVRPSLINGCYKGSTPCYIEEGSGIIDFALAAGKGFARVINCKPSVKLALVPCDVVANSLIVAGWNIGTRRSSSPLVINACSGDSNFHMTMQIYYDLLFGVVKDNIIPNAFMKPSTKFIENKILFWICAFYEHYIPAFVLDTILAFKGSKLRLRPLYDILYNACRELSYFGNLDISFKDNNYKAIESHLDPRDKEIFYMDMKDLDVQVPLKNLLDSPIYDWSKDKKSKQQRRSTVQMRTRFVNSIKAFAVIVMMSLSYLIFAAIF